MSRKTLAIATALALADEDQHTHHGVQTASPDDPPIKITINPEARVSVDPCTQESWHLQGRFSHSRTLSAASFAARAAARACSAMLQLWPLASVLSHFTPASLKSAQIHSVNASFA